LGRGQEASPICSGSGGVKKFACVQRVRLGKL
jgi:hypothetical protein